MEKSNLGGGEADAAQEGPRLGDVLLAPAQGQAQKVDLVVRRQHLERLLVQIVQHLRRQGVGFRILGLGLIDLVFRRQHLQCLLVQVVQHLRRQGVGFRKLELGLIYLVVRRQHLQRLLVQVVQHLQFQRVTV